MTRGRIAAAGAAASLAIVVMATLPPHAVRLPASDSIPEPPRGAIHVHTRRSDGSGTIDQIAAAAARAGLRFVILTDHGDGSRAPEPPSYRSGVLCIDAAEIGTDDGHLVVLGLAARAPYPLGGEARDVVEDVARLGGLSAAAHPGSRKPALEWGDWSAGFDAIEWLNADSEWRDEGVVSLLHALITYPFRKSETVTSLLDRPADVLRGWDELTRSRRVAAFAAADAHASMGMSRDSNPYGDQSPLALPGYEQVFRAFSVALPAFHPTGDPVTDARRVIDEIRAGHIYSSIDGLAAPARMAFTASSGGQTAVPGEQLIPAGPVLFDVQTTAPAGSRIELLRYGVPVASAEGAALRYEAADAAGAFRVEVRLPRPGAAGVPWLVSNPVYVGTFPQAPAREEPAVVDTLVRYRDGPVEHGWGLEKNARSEGMLDVVKAVTGTRLSLRFSLGGRVEDGPYVGLVMPAGPVAGYDRLMFSARASGPMRLAVQLRIRTPEGDHYWRRSVYVEDAHRDITVRFDDMRPVGESGHPRLALSQADSVMFMVDHAQTALGAGGRIWLDDIRYVRTR